MAANPLRGEAEIMVDQTTYKLDFSVNSFCYAQKALDADTDTIVAQMMSGTADLVLVRGIFWAALQKHHPDVHLVQAGEIMSDAGIAPVRSAIMDGLVAAFGLKKDEADAEGEQSSRPPVKKHGTG